MQKDSKQLVSKTEEKIIELKELKGKQHTGTKISPLNILSLEQALRFYYQKVSPSQ